MSKDLRSYLTGLEADEPGALKKVDSKIEAHLEIPVYLRQLEKEGQYPAVMFSNVITAAGRTSNFPVLANLFASRRRLALAVETAPENLPVELARRVRPIPPRLVPKAEAPVKQTVLTGEDIDARILPAVTHHVGDAGPYITGASLWCRDVDTGDYNCGMIRVWVRGRDRLGTHFNPSGHSFFHYRRWAERGLRMPVAICIGHHPAFYLGTQAKVTGNEIESIGGVMGEGLAVTPSETLGRQLGQDFLVPAGAEIVLEGEVLPNVMEPEGPFGDFTGYTDPAKPHNVIEVKAISFRRDAIYLDVFSGHPDHFLIDAPMLEYSLLQQLRQTIPTVTRVVLPQSGCCRFHAYIQLRKTDDAQPRTLIAKALTTDFRLKHVVVVDADIDIDRDEAVLWAIATRSQWDKDLLVLTRVNGSVLDPSGDNGITAKGGIDATVPLSRPYPKRNTLPGDVS